MKIGNLISKINKKLIKDKRYSPLLCRNDVDANGNDIVIKEYFKEYEDTDNQQFVELIISTKYIRAIGYSKRIKSVCDGKTISDLTIALNRALADAKEINELINKENK